MGLGEHLKPRDLAKNEKQLCALSQYLPTPRCPVRHILAYVPQPCCCVSGVPPSKKHAGSPPSPPLSGQGAQPCTITVAVRVRPFSPAESNETTQPIVQVDGGSNSLVLTTDSKKKTSDSTQVWTSRWPPNWTQRQKKARVQTLQNCHAHGGGGGGIRIPIHPGSAPQILA